MSVIESCFSSSFLSANFASVVRAASSTRDWRVRPWGFPTGRVCAKEGASEMEANRQRVPKRLMTFSFIFVKASQFEMIVSERDLDYKPRHGKSIGRGAGSRDTTMERCWHRDERPDRLGDFCITGESIWPDWQLQSARLSAVCPDCLLDHSLLRRSEQPLQRNRGCLPLRARSLWFRGRIRGGLDLVGRARRSFCYKLQSSHCLPRAVLAGSRSGLEASCGNHIHYYNSDVHKLHRCTQCDDHKQHFYPG